MSGRGRGRRKEKGKIQEAKVREGTPGSRDGSSDSVLEEESKK